MCHGLQLEELKFELVKVELTSYISLSISTIQNLCGDINFVGDFNFSLTIGTNIKDSSISYTHVDTCFSEVNQVQIWKQSICQIEINWDLLVGKLENLKKIVDMTRNNNL